MTHIDFWKIIEDSKPKTGYTLAENRRLLKQILITKCSAHDIMLFHSFFDIYTINLFRWDLYVAYELISKENDEDYFLTFREWIVGQGLKFYVRVTEDPDKALINIPVDQIAVLSESTTDLSWVAVEAYKEVTGENGFFGLSDVPNDDWADINFDKKVSLPLLTKKHLKE